MIHKSDDIKQFSLINEMGDVFSVSVDEYGALTTQEIIDLTRSNTYDGQNVTEAVQSIIQNSFNNLLQAQFNICNMRRFDSFSHELKPYKRTYGITTLDEYCYYPINAQFIMTEKRKEFNNKGYYRDLTLQEIISDDKIFHYIPKVFINGLLIDNFKVRCFEDKTIIIFKYNESFTEQFYQEMIDNDYPITTILFPKTNNILDKRKFNVLTFKNKAVDVLYECRYSTRNQEQIYTFSPQDEYFEIPLQDYPIPTEHILPFAKVNNVYVFLHDVTFEHYYPNIYKPVNLPENAEVEFMVFYRKNTLGTTFTNDLELFHKHKNVLSMYNDRTIPDYIKNYSPVSIPYSIPDYRKSDVFSNVDKYKLDKLQEFANADSRLMYDYLETTCNSHTYYLDVSNIDLSTRYRLDNFKEIENQFSRVVFDKPKYVFTFAKDSLIIPKTYRIFVDGVHHTCEYLYTEGEYDILYLDADRINDNSLMEIDMYQNIDIEYPLYFNSQSEEYRVNLGTYTSPIYANDIYFMDENYNMIDRTLFSLYTDNSDYPITFASNTVMNGKDFNVICKDGSMVGKRLFIKIYKGISTYIHKGNEVKNKVLETKNLKTYNSNTICVYINDRLIPLHKLSFNLSPSNNGVSKITLPYQPKENDTIVIQSLPNKMKGLYFTEKLSNDCGLIDILGILDKPLSLSWYDVYVNGVKINKNQIDIITPTKAILKNIKSTKNISIVQNNRDRECIVLKNKNISDIIWDNETDIREFYMNEIPETESSII